MHVCVFLYYIAMYVHIDFALTILNKHEKTNMENSSPKDKIQKDNTLKHIDNLKSGLQRKLYLLNYRRSCFIVFSFSEIRVPVANRKDLPINLIHCFENQVHLKKAFLVRTGPLALSFRWEGNWSLKSVTQVWSPAKYNIVLQGAGALRWLADGNLGEEGLFFFTVEERNLSVTRRMACMPHILQHWK